MPWSTNQLIAIRRVMVSLYPTSRDYRRVLDAAQLDAGMIDLEGSAVNVWFAILEHAKHQANGVERILQVALDEFPDEETLKQLAAGQTLVVDGQGKIEQWKGSEGVWLEGLMDVKVPTYTDVSFLEEGTLRARSVARVQVGAQLGTGFLLEGNRLVTNHHVLPDAASAKSAEIQFNYQRLITGKMAKPGKFKLLPDVFFQTSAADDWTVVQVDGNPNQDYGFLELTPAIVREKDRVNIIQHPGGLPKQVSFLANTVVYRDDRIVQYLTDTLPGSSGSPVFDMNWNVVALHHAGLDPDANVKYPRNEGILIDVVMKGIGL